MLAARARSCSSWPRRSRSPTMSASTAPATLAACAGTRSRSRGRSPPWQTSSTRSRSTGSTSPLRPSTRPWRSSRRAATPSSPPRSSTRSTRASRGRRAHGSRMDPPRCNMYGWQDAPTGTGRSRLVADDHPAMIEAALRRARRARLEIIGRARDGEEALQKLETRKPTVAIVDLRMPRLSGIELAAARPAARRGRR